LFLYLSSQQRLMTVAEQSGMTHAKDVRDALVELLARKAVGPTAPGSFVA
jgi:hypothetical protein